MKAELFFAGKTTEAWVREGVEEYLGRLKHYLPVTVITIESPRGVKAGSTMAQSESTKMLDRIKPSDIVMLLDERGKSYTSETFSALLGKMMVEGCDKLVIITGGAYGVSDAIRKRANFTVTFSAFTFTHQMIRILLAEQLYRAMTILKNEKYHHGG